jgi:24-methylenesterol C-methyltransferase
VTATPAADLLNAKPGRHLLDVGCGIGGPMRAIAAHSGSKVAGIKIKPGHEVNRARAHNRNAGRLDAPRRKVVCGIFMAMPFHGASFDRTDDPAHVEAVHDIERGDALPGIRHHRRI